MTFGWFGCTCHVLIAQSWWFWLVPHQVSTSRLAKSTVRNTHTNTTNTHINKMSRRCPTLQRLCPLPPWVGQRRLQKYGTATSYGPMRRQWLGFAAQQPVPLFGTPIDQAKKKGDMGGTVAFGVCCLIE